MWDLIFLAVVGTIAFVTGTIIEKRHHASLNARERTVPPVPVINCKRHNPLPETEKSELVMASVVIGADYFKYLLAGLINIFGGNMPVLESVLSRGRREAKLRLLEQVPDADYIANMRFETSVLSQHDGRALPKVEILAYGTAIYLTPEAKHAGQL